jgi:hypothetical protein
MTKPAADVRPVVEKLAEATALGIPAEVAPLAHSPAVTLPEEHPAPWSCQEELEGHPVPWHYQEEPDAYTDDARRRHVVRDAHGDVVVECVKFSKNEEEKLARLIASIPQRKAEIERLRAALVDTLELNRLKILKEVDRLRTHIAEFEAVIAKLSARLSDALRPAALRAHATQQTEGGEESQRRPMPWDYKEEPDVEGGAS